MKKRNLFIILVLILSIMVLTIGCTNTNKKPNSKDDNSVPIVPGEGDDNKETVSNNTWPSEKLEGIPKPVGNIVLVFEEEATADNPAFTLVQFEVANRQEALDYYEKLKGLDYKVDLEKVDDAGINFEGTKDKNVLRFGYLEGQNTASIKYDFIK